MSIVKEDEMRDEYDFSIAKKNPYIGRLKKQITINLNVDTIDFFKRKSAESGIPYQILINSYLTDCAQNNRELVLTWK
jgi:predicted DNA binding CopG/RHH family protein